jgi:hypothetical protein
LVTQNGQGGINDSIPQRRAHTILRFDGFFEIGDLFVQGIGAHTMMNRL